MMDIFAWTETDWADLKREEQQYGSDDYFDEFEDFLDEDEYREDEDD